ncbi:3',5'-cyclic-AMP phosphodiesterase [Shewanella surugensis]|uniref:3',5'-cyclic-AMP phosphodiesterase n=1 Tax=Shewanella surugensis TaxID=212020 RepID=A0ABT0LFF1_9GAMM|nr:3',5'-cyclic-AMP phosphodiesterase [Shewanella surugensis]MCL1126428.1 3',5'-cyclic-AMP phosphodiesterase [Shewanella surugensis]
MSKEVISYPIAEHETVRLVQITDPHLFADPEAQLLGVNTAHSLEAVLNTLSAMTEPTDLMLATGDISQDYTDKSYHNFIQAIKPLTFPCHYLPGNHDDLRIMNLHMQGDNISGHKCILIGRWQILMLNSTVEGSPGGVMPESECLFIEKAIKTAPDRHVLLAMHHNPILVGCLWLDKHCLKNGDEFLTQVSCYPQVKGLLWGHVHQTIEETYRGHFGNIKLMATPSTCIQFKPKSDYFALDALQPGYRLLDLKADGSILTNVYRVPGEHFSPDKDAGGY